MSLEMKTMQIHQPRCFQGTYWKHVNLCFEYRTLTPCRINSGSEKFQLALSRRRAAAASLGSQHLQWIPMETKNSFIVVCWLVGWAFVAMTLGLRWNPPPSSRFLSVLFIKDIKCFGKLICIVRQLLCSNTVNNRCLPVYCPLWVPWHRDTIDRVN